MKADPVLAKALDLERLYEEHGPYVQTLLMRVLGSAVDAEDLTHDVFLIAHRKRSSLELELPRSWLTRVALGLAANRRRTRHLRQLVRRTGFWGAPSVEASAEKELIEEESTRALYHLLEALPEKKRVVFILFEIQELSCVEIAELLNVPVKTVYSRLCSARHELLKAKRGASAS